MKEKTIKLMMMTITMMVLMVLSMPCFSSAPPGNGDAGYFWIPDSGDYLPLPPEKPRMPPVQNPVVSASFSRVTNILYLSFTMDLGDATITIRKEEQLIYNECLLIEDEDTFNFSFTDYGSGHYVIVIESEDSSEYFGYLDI